MINLFCSAIIILLLCNVLLALSSDHTPFSLTKTMTVTSTVFFFTTGLMYLYEANQISAFIQEKTSSCRIAQGPSQTFAMRSQQLPPDCRLIFTSHIPEALDIVKTQAFLNRNKCWLKNKK